MKDPKPNNQVRAWREKALAMMAATPPTDTTADWAEVYRLECQGLDSQGRRVAQASGYRRHTGYGSQAPHRPPSMRLFGLRLSRVPFGDGGL